MPLYRTALLSLTLLLPATVLAMSWIEADTPASRARADAEQAYEQGDKRLLGRMQRGLSLPGVAVEQRQTAIENCGVKKLAGTDVIRSQQEMDSLREQAEYLQAYNRTMLELCQQQ